jgi:hypothetical protein
MAAPRRIRALPTSIRNRKRKRDQQIADEAWDSGFGGTTAASTWESVPSASGTKLREVRMEIPAPYIPIPTVSLPMPVNNHAWAFDDKGVPIRRYGSTAYFAMETDGTSTANAGENTEVSD